MVLKTRKSKPLSADITYDAEKDLAHRLQLLEAKLQTDENYATVLSTLVATGESDASIDNPYNILKRYLVAEKLDVNKAADRLRKQAEWRLKTFSTTTATICPSTMQESLKQHKVHIQSSIRPGTRPIVIVKGCRHLPVDAAECERFITYSLETVTRLCDHGPGGAAVGGDSDGKVIGLMDLKGLGWTNLDAVALKACFGVLNQAYPERMLRIYLYNAPMIFDGLWRVVSPFIDANSREKVRFISGASARDKLLEHCDIDVLPKEYGGNGELVTVDVAAALASELYFNTRKKNGDLDGFGLMMGGMKMDDSALSLVARALCGKNDDGDEDDDVFEDAIDWCIEEEVV